MIAHTPDALHCEAPGSERRALGKRAAELAEERAGRSVHVGEVVISLRSLRIHHRGTWKPETLAALPVRPRGTHRTLCISL